MDETIPTAVSTGGSPRVALASIFTSPTRAYQEIARGAGWLWPFIVTSGLMLIGQILMKPLSDAAMAERMSSMPEEQREAMMGSTAMKIGLAINYSMMPLIVLLSFLLSAAILMLVLRGSGAKINFKPALRGVAYAGVIGMGLSQIFAGIMLQVKARSTEITGISDLPRFGLDLIGGEGLMRGVLSAFNIFSIWWLVVLVFGFAVLTGRKPSQAAPPVVGAGVLWLALAGLAAGLSFR